MKKDTQTLKKKKLVLELETIRLHDLQIVGGRMAFTTTHTQISGCVCCSG
jgi:hypothetical protein